MIVYKCVSLCLLNIGHHHQALGRVFEALELYDLLSSSIQHKLECYYIVHDCFLRLGYCNQANRWKNMCIEKLSGKPISEEWFNKLLQGNISFNI